MAKTQTETIEATEATAAEAAEAARGRRKVREGIVTSDKMEKTVIVTVTNLVRHPLYGRIMKRTSKFKAHDETNDAHVGDTVEIMETRPLSREKNWRLLRIVSRAK
ncbi:MAG: 30S ribosomal protein S17 [Capsulimonadaceae bacterium]|nr:30S ribosomal protein S17 [Capsulimonadaceae bacterium]